MITARETLIVSHLPLARALALRYARDGQSADDLVQVASVGLVKAANRWEPERGLRFSTYAVPTILGELRRYFRDMTWHVRPPRELQERYLAVNRARDELDGEPTVAALAERLDRSPEEVAEALRAGHARRAAPLEVAASATRDDDAYRRAEDRATVSQLLALLDARAREVVRLSYEHDLPQAEIASRLGVSQVHVSRILRAALDKLAASARDHMSSPPLTPQTCPVM